MSAYYNIRKPDSRIFSLGRIHPEGGRTEGKRLSKKDKNCVHIKRFIAYNTLFLSCILMAFLGMRFQASGINT